MDAKVPQYEWDVFVSHAYEDKGPFVRALVAALRQMGLRVWFDEDILTIGDSLRRSIDAGLLKSRFGIVVLSSYFFAKEWPRKELDALVARDDGREKVILPVWHEVSSEEVRNFSPLLADKLALLSSQGPQIIAAFIAALVFAEEGKNSRANRTRVPGGALDRIRDTGRILVGCISQPPLLDFTEKQEEITATGLYAMLIEEVARVEAFDIKYVGLKFSEMIDAVESSLVDIVLCTFPTPERIKRVAFTNPLHAIRVGAVVREHGARVSSSQDLNRSDIKIAVVQGEIGWEYAKASLGLEGNPHRFHILKSERLIGIMELVETGEVDAVLGDALFCRQCCEASKDLKYRLVNPFTAQERLWRCKVGVMLKKGEEDLKNLLSVSFEMARSLPLIQSEEERILSRYEGTIERIE